MKTIFITGASSGIGKACARLFQRRGWNVAAAVRNPETVSDLAALANARAYRLDVTKPETIEASVSAAIADFGGIDALVNNAGYAAMGPLEAASEEQLRRQYETNVIGLVNVTRAILPHFRSRRAGAIVNVSSIGGQIGLPLYSLYNSSKWAVEGFTEALQWELRPFGIRLRLIEPGVIKTDFYTRSMDFSKKPGLAEYDAWAGPVAEAMNKSVAKAPGPEIVAKRVWQAVDSRGWKLRWMVGKEGALVIFKRMIPNAWFFALVRAALGA